MKANYNRKESKLSPKERKKLWDALLEYIRTGKEPKPTTEEKEEKLQ